MGLMAFMMLPVGLLLKGAHTPVPVRIIIPTDVPCLYSFVPQPRNLTALANLSPVACLDFQMERLVHNYTKWKSGLNPPPTRPPTPKGSSVRPQICFSAIPMPPLHVRVVMGQIHC
jgi:hypothetical protein